MSLEIIMLVLATILCAISLVVDALIITYLCKNKKREHIEPLTPVIKPTEITSEKSLTIGDCKKWVNDFLKVELKKLIELELVLQSADGDSKLRNYLQKLDGINDTDAFDTVWLENWDKDIAINDNNTLAFNITMSNYVKDERFRLYTIGCDFVNMLNDISEYYKATSSKMQELMANVQKDS